MKLSRFIQVVQESTDRIIHDASPQQLKGLANRAHNGTIRFVLYRDGSISAGDAYAYTHHEIAPAPGAWALRGYIRVMPGGEYLYSPLDLYSNRPVDTKQYPALSVLERGGIENGQGLTEATVNRFRFEVTNGKNGVSSISAYDGDNYAGGLSLAPNRHDSSKWSATSLWVNREYRRQGLATALYDYAHQHGFAPIIPDDKLSPDGRAFWDAHMRNRKDARVWKPSMNEARETLTLEKIFGIHTRSDQIDLIIDPSRAQFDGLMRKIRVARGLQMKEPNGTPHTVVWDGHAATHFPVSHNIQQQWGWITAYQFELAHAGEITSRERLGPYFFDGPAYFSKTPLGSALQGLTEAETTFEHHMDGVLENPSYNELVGLIQRSEEQVIRGLCYPNHVVIWDARAGTHMGMSEYLARSTGIDSEGGFVAALDAKNLRLADGGPATFRIGDVWFDSMTYNHPWLQMLRYKPMFEKRGRWVKYEPLLGLTEAEQPDKWWWSENTGMIAVPPGKHHGNCIQDDPEMFGITREEVINVVGDKPSKYPSEQLTNLASQRGWARCWSIRGGIGIYTETNRLAQKCALEFASVDRLDKLELDTPEQEYITLYQGGTLEYFLRTGRIRTIVGGLTEAAEVYRYLSNCITSPSKVLGPTYRDDLLEMIDKAKQISMDTFVRYVPIREIQMRFPDYNWGRGSGLKMRDDYAVTYHRSTFRGFPCVYLRESGVENIWVRDRDYEAILAGETATYLKSLTSYVDRSGRVANVPLPGAIFSIKIDPKRIDLTTSSAPTPEAARALVELLDKHPTQALVWDDEPTERRDLLAWLQKTTLTESVLDRASYWITAEGRIIQSDNPVIVWHPTEAQKHFPQSRDPLGAALAAGWIRINAAGHYFDLQMDFSAVSPRAINEAIRLIREVDIDISYNVEESENNSRTFSSQLGAVRFLNQIKRSRSTVSESIQNELTESVQVTPSFVKQVLAYANRISWDIAQDFVVGPELSERIDEILANIQQECAHEGVLLVQREEIRSREQAKILGSVGVHWAWGEARTYHHENAYDGADEEGIAREELVPFVMTAEVTPRQVHWPLTVAHNLIHPGEEEVTLIPNSRIRIVDVVGKGWYQPGEQTVLVTTQSPELFQKF